MKKILCTLAAVLALGLIAAVMPVSPEEYKYAGYASLNPADPIKFDGERVSWGGKTFALDENTIFLDYCLDDNQIADNPYVFNNVQH